MCEDVTPQASVAQHSVDEHSIQWMSMEQNTGQSLEACSCVQLDLSVTFLSLPDLIVQDTQLVEERLRLAAAREHIEHAPKLLTQNQMD
jgi:hypothetical protein